MQNYTIFIFKFKQGKSTVLNFENKQYEENIFIEFNGRFGSF